LMSLRNTDGQELNMLSRFAVVDQ